MSFIKNTLRKLLFQAGYAVHKVDAPPYGVCAFADIKRYSGRPIKIFLDVGANIGQTAQSALEHFPVTEVYAFEPVATTYRSLEQRFRNEPRVHCLETALGATPGVSTLYLKEDSQQNTLNPSLNLPTTHSQQVSIDTLDRFIRHNEIGYVDVLKMDTENFEIEILNGATEVLGENRIGFIYAEIGLHSRDTLHTSLTALSDFLESCDFELMGIYERMYHHLQPRLRSWANALFLHRSKL